LCDRIFMTAVRKSLKINKDLVLFIYLFLLAFAAPIIFWVVNNKSSASDSKDSVDRNRSGGILTPILTQKQMSFGQQVLVTEDNLPEKQAAARAYASGDYKTALAKFTGSFEIDRNDAESLIYANNASAAIKGATLRMGASVPIGGNLNVAREILWGVAQAQTEVNRSGGIDGKLLQIEIANDDNLPEVAKQIATEFTKDDSIMAVIGHTSSEASIAAAPIYQQAGLVMISPTSVARNFSGIGSHIFRTAPSSKAMASALAKHIIDSSRKTKIAICYASKAEASRSFQEEFTNAVFEKGGQIIKTPCDFADPNFNPSQIPSQLISAGAEALVLAPSLNGMSDAIDLLQATRRRLPIFGSQTMYAMETLKQGQADANSLVLAVPWYPKSVGNSADSNPKKLWGNSSNWRTAMAYDASLVAVSGLRFGQSRDRVQQTLSNSGFSIKGVTGNVQFLRSGDRLMKVALVKVQPSKESGLNYDFAAVTRSTASGSKSSQRQGKASAKIADPHDLRTSKKPKT
jgi:branched-chain amino acid transport system substrate-binding protein